MTDLPDDIPSYDELAALFRRVAPEVRNEAAGILLARRRSKAVTRRRRERALRRDGGRL